MLQTSAVLYLQEVSTTTPFQKGAARAFFAEIPKKAGPERDAAIATFVARNQQLVMFYARRFRGWAERIGYDFMDLVGEGNIGLLRAIKDYDPVRGEFTTYAKWWIEQAMKKALYDFDGREGVSIGSGVRRLMMRVKRILRQRFEGVDASHVSPAEMHALVKEEVRATRRRKGRDPDKGTFPTIQSVTAAMRLMDTRAARLDQPLPGDGERVESIGSRIADVSATSPETALLARQELARLARRFEAFFHSVEREETSRELDIVRRRFPLDGEPPDSLTDIADEHEISRERVRQIEARMVRNHADCLPATLKRERLRFVELRRLLGV